MFLGFCLFFSFPFCLGPEKALVTKAQDFLVKGLGGLGVGIGVLEGTKGNIKKKMYMDFWVHFQAIYQGSDPQQHTKDSSPK